MPENETLFPNSTIANRWQPFQKRIAFGESLEVIFPDVQDQFYLAIRAAIRAWLRQGVDLNDLIAAQNDPVRLQVLVRQTWNNEYAQLFQEAAAGGEIDPSRESVIRSFLHAAWEQVRSHLQIDCLVGGASDIFLSQIDQMLERITSSLLKNPSRTLRLPNNTKPPQDIDKLLGESLPIA